MADCMQTDPPSVSLPMANRTLQGRSDFFRRGLQSTKSLSPEK